MMPLVTSMVPFHLFAQDDQKEMQHDSFVHVMTLALSSYDASGITNGTKAFVLSR